MSRTAEVMRRSRPVSIGTRAAAVLAAPLAPLFGLVVAYLIYHPPRQRRQRAPSALGLHPTELWINVSSEKARLHAWLCPGDPQRLVVLGHGMGLDKTRSLAQAQLLQRAGYTVVLFDFRNHGASFRDHGLTRFSRRFNDDVVAVIDHVRAMPQHTHARIAAWGFSFSTFRFLDTLVRADGAVHAVICDSGPTRDISVIVKRFPRAGLLPVPKALFVVGDRDTVVPVDQVRAVARRYPLAEVLVVPGAGHLCAIKVDKDAYTATVLDFLARALSTRSVAASEHFGGEP